MVNKKQHRPITRLAKRLQNTKWILLNKPENHRIRTFLTVSALLCSSLDWIVSGTTTLYSTAIAVLHMLGISAIIWYPHIGCLLVFLTELLCCFNQAQGGPSRLWGNCLAIGIFAFTESSLAAISLGVASFFIMQLLQSAVAEIPGVTGPNLVSSIFCSVLMAVTAALGYGLQWRTQQDRRKDEQHRQLLLQQQHAHQEEVLMYAALMHDSIASKLANIALTAQASSTNPVNNHMSNVEQNSWSLTQKEARTALDELHNLINAMTGGEQTSDSSLKQILVQLCTDWDRKLKQCGHRGESTVNDWDPSIDADKDRIHLLHGLINELYINMSKYAAKQTPYQLCITLCDEQAEVIQTNYIQDQRRSDTLGGKGLNLYRKRIEHANGIISCNQTDDTWIVYALIPMNSLESI